MTTANRGSTIAFISVTTLFFAWGFITNLIDPLIPAVKEIFHLSFAEAFLTQFAFFIAYGIFSLPGGALVKRTGYTKAIFISLTAMAVACLIFPAATHLRNYELVLLALFILGGGITVLQVAANPLAAAIGSQGGSHARLVLSQAFNSLGTVLGPYLGSAVMLSGGMFAAGAMSGDVEAARAASLAKIDSSFVMVAAMIVALMLFVWWSAKRINAAAPPVQAEAGSIFDALKSKWALFGGLAIFVYVGAEVSIASIMINFLTQPEVLKPALENPEGTRVLGVFHFVGEPAERAGKMLGWLYWFGAMVGRFAGSLLLTRIKATRLLAIFAFIAVMLCVVVSQTTGPTAGYAALSIGLFNSIMFPAIFTITLERSSAPTAATSGLLCMSIVGGAILPQVVARIADGGYLHAAYFVPAVAYLVIVVFAVMSAKAPIVSHGVAPAAGH
jgi:FHS family L-fucose permease-like MFS transporter